MLRKPIKALRTPLAAALAAAFAVWGPSADARVTKIVIDRAATPLAGDATYETITGRAFGELDPMDSHNSIITDITLAPRNANGMVEYIATFFIVKPVDMSKSSGLLWHDVPNRAGRITISSDLRAQGDIGISSGWQGDNAGATTLPVQLCLKNGYDATRLYQLVYNAKDPYVLGAGTAAFRDVGSFFRYASAAEGNMLAGKIGKSIIRGSSQSGNFTRHLIFLGMNEDEAGRIVHDGAWPLIAGRRVANNSRWGMPDGVLELYQMGSEGPQWWHSFPDRTRNIHPGGILDRCNLTNTCPKIIETFGGAEVSALKMTPSWVGTDPKNDIPVPNNVRRYYLPSSTHGGGGGNFNEAIPNVGAGCPGNNWGTGTLRANPVPATALVNRMRVALREWVMNGTEPPASKWPLMRGANAERTLVEASKAAMGFPSVPGIPDSIFLPENFAFPIFGYDWGPDYDHFNASGDPTNIPPSIDSVVTVMVPT